MSAVSMCAQCGKSSADGVGFSRAAMKRAKGKRKLGETGGCGLRCTGCAQAAQAAEKEAAVQRRAAAAAAGPADTDPNRPRAFFATPGSLYLTEIVVASGGIPCGEPLQLSGSGSGSGSGCSASAGADADATKAMGPLQQGSGPNLWLEVPAPVPGYGTSAKLRPVCRGTMAAVGMVKQDGAGETIYDEGGVPAWAFVLVEVVALTKNRFAFRERDPNSGAASSGVMCIV